MKELSMRGDTIIEVLISIALISLILGGAFTTTRGSQAAVRDSQEHAEALKLLESQIELVRADAATAHPRVFKQPTLFCMYLDALGNSLIASASPPVSANCTQDSSGVSKTPGARYVLSINRIASVNGGFLFTAQVAWDEVSGNGKASESMAYRLYQ